MGAHSPSRRGRVRAAVVTTLAVAGGAAAAGYATAAAPLVDGTPCTIAARACVSLEEGHAWLIAGGAVVRGPVEMSPGDPGYETPTGDFRVEWKHRDHVSREYAGSPMPWSVFFAPGGIAFHEGDVESGSAGCVRLGPEDAQAFYEFLRVGDPVQVR